MSNKLQSRIIATAVSNSQYSCQSNVTAYTNRNRLNSVSQHGGCHRFHNNLHSTSVRPFHAVLYCRIRVARMAKMRVNYYFRI